LSPGTTTRDLRAPDSLGVGRWSSLGRRWLHDRLRFGQTLRLLGAGARNKGKNQGGESHACMLAPARVGVNDEKIGD